MPGNQLTSQTDEVALRLSRPQNVFHSYTCLRGPPYEYSYILEVHSQTETTANTSASLSPKLRHLWLHLQYTHRRTQPPKGWLVCAMTKNNDSVTLLFSTLLLSRTSPRIGGTDDKRTMISFMPRSCSAQPTRTLVRVRLKASAPPPPTATQGSHPRTDIYLKLSYTTRAVYRCYSTIVISPPT